MKLACFAALTASLSGCWLALDLDDKEFTLQGGGGTGEGGGAQGAGGATGCPDRILVDTASIPPFCIDPTEVTVSEYADFLAGSPSVDDQISVCAVNAAFEPTSEDDCVEYDYDRELAAHPSYPIRCVDWCDAVAFCAAAGARLCGGAGGAPLDSSDENFNDSATSEWFAACTDGGTTGTFDASGCHGDDGSTMPIDVGTDDCEGGVPGVFDMLGNVSEWTNACGDAGAPECILAGLNFFAGVDQLRCESVFDAKPRLAGYLTAGFRCCADLR